ncbi:ubiquitin-specific protease ESD4 [Trifolium repens]|nr:ubiquitin-specific protease ESD4 [Trifolium repens]
MRKPSPPRSRRRMKHTIPETKATIKRVRMTSNTTTRSITSSKQYSESRETKFKEFIDLSSSRYNSSREIQSEDEKGYESTASTPKDDDRDFYLNFHPQDRVGYEGGDVRFYIPEWIPMTFRPTPKMCLNDICSYTAAYIFKRDDDQILGDEVLVRTTSDVYGDRKALKSLMPRCPVDQEIINLVVARNNWYQDQDLMGKDKDRRVWYFPTEFAQFALESTHTADEVREMYLGTFIKPKALVSKIFIPINDNGNHWYLLVIDLMDRKCIWLDSLPDVERYHERRHAILSLGMFVEKILYHPSVGIINRNIHDNLITNFSTVQPRGIPHQRHGSNDCGVWVAKWMIECPYMNDYENVTVVTATRMKLALFICHSSNNMLRKELVSKAARNWDDQHKRRRALVKV